MYLAVVGSNVFPQNLFTPDDRHTIRYAHKNRTQIPLSHIGDGGGVWSGNLKATEPNERQANNNDDDEHNENSNDDGNNVVNSHDSNGADDEQCN